MNSIQKIFNQPGSIIYLLPYTSCFKLTNRQQKTQELLLIQNIIKISILALESFLDGNLLNFDAQVGENLCQIRAYKNIHLARFWLNNSERKNKLMMMLVTLHKQKSKIDCVINEWENSINEIKQYNKSLDQHETIVEFLKRQNIYTELSEDTIYLISCYFLTHFAICNDGIPVAINFNKISSEFNVSKHRAERLSHRFQLIVAKLGCDFIIKIASELTLAESYLRLLPKLLQLSDVDRYVLPCYLVSEIILEHAIKNNIPILLLFHRVSKTPHEVVYFLLNSHSYHDLPDLENDYCFVISGVNQTDQPTTRNYLTYLDNLNLIELVLSNTATHPQYSGSKLNYLQDNPFQSIFGLKDTEANFFSNRLENLKELAYKIGCCKENPSEFFLKHIYASKPCIEIDMLKSKRALIISGKSLLAGSSKENAWNEEAVLT